MTDMVEVPPPRPHSSTARFIDCMVQVCAIVPYSLAALVLRVVMARVFFATGQEMIDGPKRQLRGYDYALTLPAQVRDETLRLFETKFADSPFSPKLMAYVVSYADFILPILLVLGLATRFAAVALVLLVVLIDRYLEPGTFWSLHIYWYAIFLVLMSGGAGAISFDYVIRQFYDR